MADKKTLTFALMDAPFESARTATALRIINVAVSRGYDVNVWAYEGAAALAFLGQAKHANGVHGRDLDQEDHPLPREWVAGLFEKAAEVGGKLDWINCGLCADERGVNDAVEGVRRGTPGDLFAWANASDNTLIVPTR